MTDLCNIVDTYSSIYLAKAYLIASQTRRKFIGIQHDTFDWRNGDCSFATIRFGIYQKVELLVSFQRSERKMREHYLKEKKYYCNMVSSRLAEATMCVQWAHNTTTFHPIYYYYHRKSYTITFLIFYTSFYVFFLLLLFLLRFDSPSRSQWTVIIVCFFYSGCFSCLLFCQQHQRFWKYTIMKRREKKQL